MTKGEIWVTELPTKGGHVQRGMRTALIVGDPSKSIAIVIPITSVLAATRFPYTLSVIPTKGNGLEKSSVLLILQLNAIDKRFLNRKIGMLETATLQQVDDQLKTMLRIP